MYSNYSKYYESRVIYLILKFESEEIFKIIPTEMFIYNYRNFSLRHFQNLDNTDVGFGSFSNLKYVPMFFMVIWNRQRFGNHFVLIIIRK